MTNTTLLVVQDFTGDSKFELKWDPNNKQEVEAMKSLFLDLQKQGYIFFEVKTTFGMFKRKGKVVNSFDPKYEHLMIDPLCRTSAQVYEVEETKKSVVESTSCKIVDPKKDEIKDKHKYIAAAPVIGG